MSASSQGEVVFLLPTTLYAQRGPVAGWLNTIGWVTAAARAGYGTTVVTQFGLADPAYLRQRASEPAEVSRARTGLRSVVPLPLKTAIKDVREFVRSRQFARIVDRANLPTTSVAFVWQRHELFQSAGARLAEHLRCPFVLYVPAPKIWEARSWGVRRPGWEGIVQKLGDISPFRQADLIACVSEEVADEVARLGVDAARIVITPSTVDTSLFRPDIDGSTARRRYSLQGKFVVGWTGSFRSFHGLNVIVDAIAEVREHVPGIVAVFVGDGPERKGLEAAFDCRGLNDHVRFTGMVPQNELPEILKAFDVAFISSRAGESFHYSPLKLWEYLATGLPVVVPSAGSLPRLLQHGVNAVLVEPGDPHALADAICQLAGDEALRLRLGRAGREVAESASWDVQLDHLISRLHAGGA